MIRTLALAAMLGSPAAAETVCIANGIDISSSVDHPEWLLMRDGIADALTDPRIVDAAESGEVWLAAYLWSREQRVIVDWTRVAGRADLEAVAAQVRAVQRGRTINSDNTAVAEALRFGGEMLARAPWCDRLVLDIVSDGTGDNGTTGLTLDQAKDALGWSIETNVLSIGEGNDEFWRDRVASGFTVHVDGFDQFALGFRRKLILEVAGL